MNYTIFYGLMQNAALLLAMAFLFDVITSHWQAGPSLLKQAAVGFIIGVIGITAMMTTWVFVPGIVFDTRSVLLGISGLFFGFVPTTMAMAMATTFRFYLGGPGTWTGAAVIVSTGAIGIAWRYCRRKSLQDISWIELYLFGIVIHIVMLAIMLTLPWEIALRVLSTITLPVLAIYPLGTALLGVILVNRLRREQEAQVLANAMERLRRSLWGTVQAISTAVEVKDPYTAGHQRRTADLAGAIAVEMGFSADRVESIRLAAIIHDIGKIAIPTEILSRPKKLTEIEFSLIKIHPQVGYDILKDVEFPPPVAEVILQHHERMDGSGYPQGLQNEAILLEARIIAVADVVESMASHRPYRPALGIDAALDEIEQQRGILYDPAVVDACLKVFRQKGFQFGRD